MKLLFILFILKLDGQISIFKYIQKKHGSEMIKLARRIKKQLVKIAKIKCDIKFMWYCKKNNLVPIFTKLTFTIRVSNYLRNKISRQILETEIQNEHVKKKKLTWQLKGSFNHINNKIGFICKIVLYNRIKNIVSKEKCTGDKIHNKKRDKLHSERRYISKPKYCIIKNIINNFSLYTLTSEEEYAPSFSLDQHMPSKNDTRNIKTEFESFFYHIQKHIKNLDQDLQDEIKTNIEEHVKIIAN